MADRYIYTITCAINGMVYVGCSKDPKRRWNEHTSLARNDLTKSPLYTDMRIYGKESFVIDLVEIVNGRQAAKQVEALTISRYNTIWPNGYNLNSELGIGKSHHPLSKMRISELAQGRSASDITKQRASETHTGVSKKEEHRRKISEALKGKPKSEEVRKKMSASAKVRPSRSRTKKGTYV